MSKQWTVAVVGATGMVGREMLRVLEQRSFPVGSLKPLASSASAGKHVTFRGQDVTVMEASPAAFEGVEVALFSAGASISEALAPAAAAAGAIVIDNSSAWRMDPDCPLCVPEVNLAAARNPAKGIIANPNCSTIQLVTALAPLHRAATLTRLVVSTYQAISGAGAEAVAAFRAQQRAWCNGNASEAATLKGVLAGNLLMHWSVDTASGYQEEELKIVHETRKILNAPDIAISPTAVRVPVLTGHSESVTLETKRPLDVTEARSLLAQAPGVKLVDDFAAGDYPTPQQAAGTDPVLVGRIRQDIGNPTGLQMWIVGDNLRKGAALNAVQIAEGLLL